MARVLIRVWFGCPGDEVNGAASPRVVSAAESESEQTGLLAGDNKSSVESVKSGVAEEQVDLESQVVENKQDVPELSRNDPAVGFLEAWRIPGVATFALCLFFSKLVAYTFLYWLPFYIRQTRKPHNPILHTITYELLQNCKNLNHLLKLLIICFWQQLHELFGMLLW